jgi:hypothetical protein
MNIDKKSLVILGLAAALLSSNVSAQEDDLLTGYFGSLPSNLAVTIPAGASGVPGAAIKVVEKTVKPGNYLITAQLYGQSYAPNSGAVCFFTGNGIDPRYQTLNTSSDWSALKVVTSVILGNYSTSVENTKVSITCQRGYSFTGSSQFWGTLMLVPVRLLDRNPA